MLPARNSGFRHSRTRLLEVLDRPTHLGGGPPRPLAPVEKPRHTAASREPYRSDNARNRIVVSIDGSASH